MLTIISACEEKTIEEVVAELKGQGYGALKTRTADAIINVLRPIREKYNYYLTHQDELLRVMEMGAKKAEVVAKETLQRAKSNMGLL